MLLKNFDENQASTEREQEGDLLDAHELQVGRQPVHALERPGIQHHAAGPVDDGLDIKIMVGIEPGVRERTNDAEAEVDGAVAHLADLPLQGQGAELVKA